MFFGRKKPRLTLAQTLSAKPKRLVEGTLKDRDDGGVNLNVPMKQMKWAGWLLRMPEGASKTFEMDEMGRFVWESIDGKTSVQQIIRKLSKFCRITPAEAKPATLSFLQMLGKKGLIGFATRRNKDEG